LWRRAGQAAELAYGAGDDRADLYGAAAASSAVAAGAAVGLYKLDAAAR
jgi:hypothetical protein